MSRQAATKSRAGDKAGAVSRGGAQSVTVPVVSTDVIPGRLTSADWEQIAGDDDCTQFVGTIVDDIVENVLNECYKVYIENQVLPYTVSQTRTTLLQMVQWHFLSRDAGEVDIRADPGWTEESEPEPTVIDSWAQGSVPVIIKQSSSTPPSGSIASEDPNYVQGRIAPTNIAESCVSEVTETITESEQPSEIDKKPSSPTGKDLEIENQKPAKRKCCFKRHSGPVPAPAPITDDKEKPATPATPKKDLHLSSSQRSLLKLQAGRPPGNREVTFDEHGNVVGVMKLNARTLPNHKIHVVYNVVDPDEEANSQRLAALRGGRLRPATKFKESQSSKTKMLQSRMDQQLASSQLKPVQVTRPQPPTQRSLSSRQSVFLAHKTDVPLAGALQHATATQRQQQHRATASSAATTMIHAMTPSLIDTIEASPGVVVEEGGVVKRGPDDDRNVALVSQLRRAESRLHRYPQSTKELRLLGARNLKQQQQTMVLPNIHPRDLVTRLPYVDFATSS